MDKISNEEYLNVSHVSNGLPNGTPKPINLILNSSIFENVINLPNITKEYNMTVTSAKYSTLEFVNEPEVGKNFTVRIHARDGLNRSKTHGGDFWMAFLQFPSNHYYASTSAQVQDHQNGTYTVDFFIGWPSAVEVRITLVHPSRATKVLDLIMNLSYPPRMFWNGTFINQNNQTAHTLCYMAYRGPQFWKDKCQYVNRRALGDKTGLVCEKPPDGFGCDSMVKYSTAAHLIDGLFRVIGNACGCVWLFDKDHYMQKMKPEIIDMVQHLGSQYAILDNITKTLPPCNSHFQHGVGFWRANYWVSMVCQPKQGYKFGAKVGECLRNKDVYFLGDSTTRLWAFHLSTVLKAPMNKMDLTNHTFKFKQYFEHFNLNITFRFHPQVLGSKVVDLQNEIYEVDVIDDLQSIDCNFVVVISPWAHFAQWWKDAYVERLRLLRASVERLKARCPGAQVILKSPHVREHGDMYSQLRTSDYILFKLKEMMEDVFRDADVYYVNIWDLNNAFKGKKSVHMPPEVINQELSILLSYLCTDA
ncbi:NXPE family member 1-like [Amphiura filiformis]|uniref:NXPE family member 1-like n=1 Tax=Amphiura filiformis TaxID=82378 RepID=UPI003B2166AB